MSERKPVMVLVHGAWHRKEMWRKLIAQLPDDLDVRTLQLPSSAPVPPSQLGDLYDDARTIRAATDAVDGPVIVVCHSYGAAPTNQGLAGAQNVRRIVSITGFQLDVGDSMTSSLGFQIPYFWGTDHYAEGYFEMTDPLTIFYPDLDPVDAKSAADALGPQSVASLEQTLTQAAWRTIDTTYIHGTEQAAIEMFDPYLRRARRVRTIDTAHSPFLNRPRELAELLRQDLADVSQS
ncbi:alpha/beta hydrolase [Actinoplanes sp. TBRC 11911]|uniref:alpha/beta hydrolase n=1 Tax=Actinoplanes sp. TBRC 11911 TaxID=2729386 RepID=UPI00145DD6C4|nr:alpha/beta hydrolase [Actinoplanes sp. TBRC 11911]NMO50995.1 alpha/beta hydrolase [Actinoplanes sp. TBRC 11911]